MATVRYQVANPTDSDVTVSGKTAPAHDVVDLDLSDAGSDVEDFLEAGCAITSVEGSTFLQREQQGFMLQFEHPYES